MRLFLKILIILVGVATILAAVPIGYIAEIAISGCCGAPSNGREGQGFVIGGIIGVIGLFILIKGVKFKRIPTN